MERANLSWPHVPSLEVIAERLPLIFPEGTENRNYVIREMAARTLYVMFYAGAVEGADRWIRPSQVTDMSDVQATLLTDEERQSWVKQALSSKKDRPVTTWYAPNSREPVRDETIRYGFIALGAVIERTGLPVTTPLPKYAMSKAFAALFNVDLIGDDLEALIRSWQNSHLNAAALSRIRLLGAHATAAASDQITATLPNSGLVMLESGPSGVIGKAVIEQFARKFLKTPAVLWLSQSGEKVGIDLASRLKLKIDPSKTLPDVILVDLGTKTDGSDMLFVFIEIVASDGPINSMRKQKLTEIAIEAGFSAQNLAFVTAFQDRSAAPFKKAMSELAWGTYAWFCSEPDNLIELRNGSSIILSELL
ncbi:restriction endonuclease [Vibrio cholerae]|nr:restriction endonuclease [Vibrio cholerae]QKU60607.1 restriction endonuclease [Vibrio cholerae]QKU64240.1 restriction endonuclease [Vibrio cholerae]QKU68123.1 restriction endonuclease [Vibrio cholerae]